MCVWPCILYSIFDSAKESVNIIIIIIIITTILIIIVCIRITTDEQTTSKLYIGRIRTIEYSFTEKYLKMVVELFLFFKIFFNIA